VNVCLCKCAGTEKGSEANWVSRALQRLFYSHARSISLQAPRHIAGGQSYMIRKAAILRPAARQHACRQATNVTAAQRSACC
jgi:hypothetical protein